MTTLTLLVFGSGQVATQTTASSKTLSFEVASVRPSKDTGFNFVGVRSRPGGLVEGENVSLRQLIAFAYRLDIGQDVEGGGDLLDENYDVLAKAAPDVPRAPFGTVGPLNLMMQDLLAKRFQLVTRWENRRQPGYALIRLAPNKPLGPGISASELNCTARSLRADAVDERGRCALISVVNNELNVPGHEMADIARHLSFSLRQPVIDRTGLAGAYRVRMTYDQLSVMAMAGLKPPAGVTVESNPNLPSLFTAIQTQLGLKLEPQSVNVPTLIVEHVERPTPN